MKLKYLAKHIDERHVDEATQLLSVSKIKGVVPRSEVSDNQGRAEDISHYKTCKPNDLVINRMAAYQGALGIAKQFGAISPDYMVLRFNGSMDPRYVGHLFKSSYMANEMSSRVKGIGSIESGSVRTPRLSWSDLGEVEVRVPPIAEQKAIADFLDRELSQIDHLINKQRRLVGLLLEMRTGVIDSEIYSQTGAALTKIKYHTQLNPSVPQALKNSSNTLATFMPMEALSDDGVLDLSRERIAGELIGSYSYFEPGDVLVAKVTPCFENGKGAVVVEATNGFGFGTTEVSVLRPMDSAKILSEYLYYVTMTSKFRSEGTRQMTGAGGLKRVPESFMNHFEFPLLGLDKQRQIVEAISNRLNLLKSTMEAAEKANNLLLERRSALISAAVTGKIHVRGKS